MHFVVTTLYGEWGFERYTHGGGVRLRENAEDVFLRRMIAFQRRTPCVAAGALLMSAFKIGGHAFFEGARHFSKALVI